jgi:hypothetical protein
MFENTDDILVMSQIRTADFARMSSSKQLSLWTILRAQISSKKQLAAEAAAATQAQKSKPVRASPGE